MTGAVKDLRVVVLVSACCRCVGGEHGRKDGCDLVGQGKRTMDRAHKGRAGGVAGADKRNTLMNIAVVDSGGNLKAFVRMDGAFLASIDIAIKKAVTARSLNMSTLELSKVSQPGQELYGIEVTNGGMAIFGGGELLLDKNGVIIGAVGVSGGSVAEDVAVAKAGASALGAAPK